MSLLNVFKKKKVNTEVKEVSGDVVNIHDKAGNIIDKKTMGDKEKRMLDVLETISKAGKTEKYMICMTIHDPKNKLNLGGGDLHHFTFVQDFPQDDRYGCLDEYATLMKLGDR